ncbi:MAG: hypothetical protein GY927_00135 [bacterium]|nr:hypothetical protein [bacterium]
MPAYKSERWGLGPSAVCEKRTSSSPSVPDAEAVGGEAIFLSPSLGSKRGVAGSLKPSLRNYDDATRQPHRSTFDCAVFDPLHERSIKLVVNTALRGQETVNILHISIANGDRR